MVGQAAGRKGGAVSAFKLTPTGELMSFLVGLNLPKGSQADEIRERGIAWLRQAPEDFSAREEDLRARIAELEGKLAIIVKWLEENQPDVFRRGLWDEISDPTAQALARLVEAVGRLVDMLETHDSDGHPPLPRERAVINVYRAYQAARSGRGEVVPTPNRTRRDRIEGAVRAIETLQAHGIYLHDAVGTPLGGAEFLAVMPSILEAMKDQPPAPGPATKETP